MHVARWYQPMLCDQYRALQVARNNAVFEAPTLSFAQHNHGRARLAWRLQRKASVPTICYGLSHRARRPP